jgi:hypothetical protein
MPMFCMAQRESKCYVVGECVIDTQGFPQCHTTPNMFFLGRGDSEFANPTQKGISGIL